MKEKLSVFFRKKFFCIYWIGVFDFVSNDESFWWSKDVPINPLVGNISIRQIMFDIFKEIKQTHFHFHGKFLLNHKFPNRIQKKKYTKQSNPLFFCFRRCLFECYVQMNPFNNLLFIGFIEISCIVGCELTNEDIFSSKIISINVVTKKKKLEKKHYKNLCLKWRVKKIK